MHEASTIEKLASVNEKLQIATSSLQQSIGGITQVMNSQNEKVHHNSNVCDDRVFTDREY